MAAEQLKIVSQTTIFPLGEISNFTPKGKDTPPTVPLITQKHRQPTPQPTPLTARPRKGQSPPCEGPSPMGQGDGRGNMNMHTVTSF